MPAARPRKPRYVELADQLIAEIEGGRHQVGGLLPTELELCRRHRVSRHTARAALSRLTAAGMVERRRGTGTRITAGRSAIRYQHEVATIEDLLQYGNETHLVVHQAVRVAASATLATQLRVAVGSALLHLSAVRYEEPRHIAICTTEVWVRPGSGVPAARLLAVRSAARTLATLLDPARLVHVQQTFDAARFERAQAQALGVPTTTPALRVLRRYEASGGQPLALAISLHPAGRFAYRITLERRST